MEGKANLGYEPGPERKASKGFLDVDCTDANSHTYVYNPQLSLRRMTIEALPSEEAYEQKQDIRDIHDYR